MKNIREARACLRCGAVFMAKQAEIRRGWGKYCSRSCSTLTTGLPGQKTSYWYKKRALERNRFKFNARRRLYGAVKRGLVVKGVCAVCGSEDVHGHHTDYSRALDVTWLCRLHHEQAHGKMVPGSRKPDLRRNHQKKRMLCAEKEGMSS